MNKSPKSATTTKDKAWKAMSEYIRVKGCLETTNTAFVGVCFTCDRRFHISYLEAGHCFSGRRNARLFDVMIIRQQCTWCNRIKHGEEAKFKKKLAAIHSEEWVVQRKIRGNRVIKDNQVDWDKLLAGIKRMRDTLLRNHGYKTFGEILKEAR